MMNFETIGTGCIDDASMPWMPYLPWSEVVQVKMFKADPVRGEFISLLKAPPGMELPRHYHTGTVIVYTLQGRWKYKEHAWTAGPGSVVFETAGSAHTPIAAPDCTEDIITFNINVGDLLYTDANDNVVAKENWRTAVERYLAHCKAHGIVARDITSFAE